MAISSAILRADAMSCVIETAAQPRSFTMSTMRSLMASAVMGSRPVVGSSKNRMSGRAMMARALLHAAGQFHRPHVGEFWREAHFAHRFDRALARVLARDAIGIKQAKR